MENILLVPEINLPVILRLIEEPRNLLTLRANRIRLGV